MSKGQCVKCGQLAYQRNGKTYQLCASCGWEAISELLSLDTIESTVIWHKPADRQPICTRSILIWYEGAVWPGVYEAVEKKVIRYPEDYRPVKIEHVELWANMPTPPKATGSAEGE